MAGSVAVEMMVGLGILVLVMGGFGYGALRLWEQIQAEASATQLVRAAVLEEKPPGHIEEQESRRGTGVATVEWTEEHVQVTIHYRRTGARAVRKLPRET